MDWSFTLSIISILSTIVVAALTYVYVKLTHGILEATKQSIFEQIRPYIIANLYSANLSINLSIQNIGRRPARNLKIVFEPPLDIISQKDIDGNLELDSSSMLNMSFIPPDFQTATTLIENPEYFKIDNVPDFKVTLTYQDLENNSYNENYIISLKYISTKKIAQFTKEHYFGRIAKSLENLTEIQKKK